MMDGDGETPDPVPPITSPTGISPWIWLPVLTVFMGFVIWLSLRNFLQLLPLRVQYAVQDFADRAGYRGQIRLNDDGASTLYLAREGEYTDDEDDVESRQGRRAGYGGRYHSGRSEDGIALDAVSTDDEGEEDDDGEDDELPLAAAIERKKRRQSQRSSFSRSGRERKLDRLVSLFSGKSGRTNEVNDEEQGERILDLPNSTMQSPARRVPQPRKASYGLHLSPDQALHSFTDAQHRSQSPTSARDLLRQRSNSSEADATPLPSRFNLPRTAPLNTNVHRTPSQSPETSPTIDRRMAAAALRSSQPPPRSPIRSPSMSRTPSLNAIPEDPAETARHSAEFAASVRDGIEGHDVAASIAPKASAGFPRIAESSRDSETFSNNDSSMTIDPP